MTTRQAAIWALAVGQTLGYACLYYIFAALVVQWQADLGWSKATLALGPTLAIVISGGLAPFVGHLVDRGRSRELLGGGAALGAAALAGLALSVTQTQYLMAWAVIGVSQAAVLYEVCFALLIRRLGPEARAAIIRVTLVAGFASTLAFPVAAVVSDTAGWRAVVWLAAAVVLGVQLPLNLWATGVLRRTEDLKDTADAGIRTGAVRRALATARFWALGLVLAVLSLNHWMLIAFIVPLFTALGAETGAAVAAASLVGPAQVLGRLTLMRLDRGLSNGRVMALCLSAMALGVAALLLAGASPVWIFVFAALQGASVGIMTILRPVLIADVMGPGNYGAIAGSIQVMPLLAAAAAPLVGGLLFEAGGAFALIWMSAGLVALATLGTAALRRL